MQTPPPFALPAAAARRFMRRAQLLDRNAPDIASALGHLGYVQIDPTNVCGRMHDLILRVRVAHYREGDLVRHLHGGDGALPAEQRLAFEHHLPSTSILVAFAPDAWPHLLAYMRQRTKAPSWWSGRLSRAETELSLRILEEIRARGPLTSEEIGDRRAGRTYWGRGTIAKTTMQKLYSHGRLLIAGRAQGRRRYDLPERVLPARILALREPAAEETARWLALILLRQRRLARLKRTELAAVADLVQPVQVEGAPLLHCLKTDAELLEAAAAAAAPRRGGRGGPVLLAPLDPLIYDRPVTRAIWDFDYVWEAYVPPAKRRRGHFAMPLLSGLEIVGHVDPKADRAAGRLRVVSRSVRRGYASAPAVKELASFLGLKA